MADIQTEKAFQKQDGINGMNKYLLFNLENPKHKVTKKTKSGSIKRDSKRMKATRYFKKVGLGFSTPDEAIRGEYVDKKCPFIVFTSG